MITVVFGKPRVGKTAFLVANMAPFLNRSVYDRDLYQRCCDELRSINFSGNFDFALPKHSPVYSDFKTCFQVGYKRYEGSYYIDGFHLGHENKYVEIYPVLPCSKIFLTEAQRYYDSSHQKLARWVSGWYEEHGHFDLDIWMDTQRPILIHKNIRELVNRFIYIEKMINYTDKMGNIIGHEWIYKEFDDWKYAEEYINNGNTAHCETKTFTYVGNVFENYESRCYREQFIPVKNQFSMMQHIEGASTEQELELLKTMYSQSAPNNYWPDEIPKNVKVAI
ncbi:MAG: hypothetical protein K2M64_02795 [Clostridia bacterium]|nr:hypothetical protein [Clostridia bacterium]